MERINDTHRAHPRTLQEAFGPYEFGPVHPPPAPRDPRDVLVLLASAVAFAVVIVLVLLGVIQ